jgi:hypothetical protein
VFAAMSLLAGSAVGQADEDGETKAPTGESEASAEEADGAARGEASGNAPETGQDGAPDEASTDASANGGGSASLSAALAGNTEANPEGNATTTGASAAPVATAPSGYRPPEAPDPNYSFGVQLLPGSAYPEPQVRGIKGGSLWFTMHGLQWPYMPMRGEPGLMLGLSGFGWVDTGWERIKRGDSNQDDIEYWIQAGRFGLRATPTYSQDNWFVQGQVKTQRWMRF